MLSGWHADASLAVWPLAWVSLDEGDNDPLRFWTYVISALNTLHSGVGETPLALMYASSSPPIEDVLTSLLNALIQLPTETVLVLDDYHLIEAQPIHNALTYLDADQFEPAVDPDRFLPADHQWSGHWVSFPSNWEQMPEDRVLSQETHACIHRAIEVLPPNQREIITLRDIEGWSAEETCTFLDISEGNQRVLLHRARSKVRGALEKYFDEE